MSGRIAIQRHGGPEVLEWEELPRLTPGPDEALLEQTCVGVNFIDTYHRSGLYPLASLPHGIGVEAVGRVRALGPASAQAAGAAASLQVGQRVAYVGGPPGAYAEQRVVPASSLIALPDDVSDRVAAAALLKGMTAEFLVQRCAPGGGAPVAAGEWALVHAAAGGLGLLLTRWLSHRGVRVIGTASTAEKAALAREQGAEVTVLEADDFVARCLEVTSQRGVQVAYDLVGKTTFHRSLHCMARRGLLVGVGNASGRPEPLDVGVLAQRGSLFVTRPTLFDYIAEREEREDSAAAVFGLLRQGVLRPHIGQTFCLRDAAAAHRALESRATLGATLLLPHSGRP